jgi:hypothetical protein
VSNTGTRVGASLAPLSLTFTLDMMRIRLSAEEPPLKAWFNVESKSNILQLKRAMCKDVHALHDIGVDAPELELLLDDFELLDESSVDVLREGDLIW